MMTEKMEFKKDKTPYYVFSCSKCQQYSYVKTTQKTKKCLRCGRRHQIKNIAFISEIMTGITAAKDRVIELQDELARKEFGFEPVFHANNDLILIPSKSKKTHKTLRKIDVDGEGKLILFKTILNSLQKQYPKYPFYLIELAAQDKGFSREEIKFLMIEFLTKRIVQRTSEDLYYLTS